MKYRIKLQRRVTYDTEVTIEATSAIAAMQRAEELKPAELAMFEVEHVDLKYVAVAVNEVTE
jgi:hypothetical protein